MIRAALIITGLILGLVLALLFEGRMHHLRALAGNRLPDWSAAIAGDAGLLRGHAGFSSEARLADIHWQFKGLSARGFNYRLRLTSPGMTLDGDLHLPFHRRTAALSNLKGEVEIARPFGPGDLTGILRVGPVSGDIDLINRRLLSLQGQGVLGAAQLDGTDLGNIQIDLAPDQANSWLASLSSENKTLTLMAEARGQFDQNIARIKGEISAGAGMPQSWQRWFNQNLTKTASGWQIDQTIDLK